MEICLLLARLTSRRGIPWENGDNPVTAECLLVLKAMLGRCWGQAGAHHSEFYPKFCHFAPKVRAMLVHQAVLQMCLLNVFNIAVADRVIQPSLSHTSSCVRGDCGYKPVFVSFPGNDRDTGLAAQITAALQGLAMVISLCALEAFFGFHAVLREPGRNTQTARQRNPALMWVASS